MLAYARVRIGSVRSIRGPVACVPVELGGKANKTYAFSALERWLEQRPLISRAMNRDFFSLCVGRTSSRSFRG